MNTIPPQGIGAVSLISEGQTTITYGKKTNNMLFVFFFITLKPRVK